jgi:hypothetical protein
MVVHFKNGTLQGLLDGIEGGEELKNIFHGLKMRMNYQTKYLKDNMMLQKKNTTCFLAFTCLSLLQI